MTREATDAELSAAIAANSRPAAMVRLDCGDIDIIESHEIRENDWTECPDGCGQQLVTEVTHTAIVDTVHVG